MTYKSISNDSGMSQVIGVILITALVVAASAIAYAAVNVYELEQPVIANINIESVNTSNQEVVLVHRGGNSFDVSEISIIISVNGETIPHNLIELPVNSTTGFGAPGGVLHGWSNDNFWDSGDTGDFRIAKSNRELHPGDLLKVIIYHRPSERIITSPEHRV